MPVGLVFRKEPTTPDAVRPYLREFLTDPRICPMHPLAWNVILKTHPTNYSYTRIGKIADTDGLAETVGTGNVEMSFNL